MGQHVNRREIETFPCTIKTIDTPVLAQIQATTGKLMADFRSNAKTLTNDYGKHGTFTIQTFQPRLSKAIIDDIDRAIARYYRFTEEEAEFIINFDIKYRMGQDGGAEEGE